MSRIQPFWGSEWGRSSTQCELASPSNCASSSAVISWAEKALPPKGSLEKCTHVLFPFALCTGVLQKELSRHYIHQPRGCEHLQWTALGLNNFWNSVVTAGVRACSEGLPPWGCTLYTTAHSIFTLQQTLHTRDTGVQWFQVLTKRPIVLLKCSSCTLQIWFQGAGHQQQPSTRFCDLKDSRAEAHLFCKLSQAVRFFPVAFQSTLSSYIRDSIYLKTMWSCQCAPTFFDIGS